MTVDSKVRQSSPAVRSKRLGSLRRRLNMDWQLYLIILLPLIWLIVFQYIPMYGAQIAFRKFQATKGIVGSDWVGLANFAKFFQSYNFKKVIVNTLAVSFYDLIVGFPFPIILALLLNNCLRPRFKKITQIVTYMPYFISTVVMVGMIIQFTSPKVGIINFARQAMGLSAIDFMAIPGYFRHIYVWTNIWQGSGWNAIIYLSALAAIDPGLHEAAMIDGASRWKRMIHVDIPGIFPTITVLLILRAGQIMNVGFEKMFLMQNPLNLDASEIISTYVYKQGLAAAAPDFSYASSIGLFNSVINLILICTVNYVSNKLSETSLW
ncbi:ABC transporter permease subunit [Ruminococcaceae bacterium OttesenSCG-928-L11]|nr:ABC transporter permease subunit [Ruminococcaceae bacterium OttesenSCG-928-L11]